MNVGVIGSGTMGNGIAQVIAMNGYHVTVVDKKEKALQRAATAIEMSLQKLKKRDSALQPEQILSRFTFTTDIQELENMDFVIEAIPEIIEVKQAVFKQLDQICKEETIFITNTSSLLVKDIASVTNRPDRFTGMHFFNPVPLMNLIEVVFTDEISEMSKELVRDFSKSLQKEVIEVKDSPLFIVNRLLVPLICEAIALVGENIASPADIDKAMQLGAGHNAGPLKTADMIGLDVLLSIQQALYEKTQSEKYAVPPLLIEMVKKNELGKKTGKGFYQYE